MKGLTHLSLVDGPIDFIGSPSVFKIALLYGGNLQCLRIRGCLESSSHSRYFRRCAHSEALPHLTSLGIYVTLSHPHSDMDFFPAVCDFLGPSKVAQLVHLELGAPGTNTAQDRLGYNGGRGCWALFKKTNCHHLTGAKSVLFPHLESLSMPLPTGKANFSLHYSRLIPKGVTRLSLSGHILPHNSIHQIFKVVSIQLDSRDVN
jgi:hypothetical protein